MSRASESNLIKGSGDRARALGSEVRLQGHSPTPAPFPHPANLWQFRANAVFMGGKLWFALMGLGSVEVLRDTKEGELDMGGSLGAHGAEPGRSSS